MPQLEICVHTFIRFKLFSYLRQNRFICVGNVWINYTVAIVQNLNSTVMKHQTDTTDKHFKVPHCIHCHIGWLYRFKMNSVHMDLALAPALFNFMTFRLHCSAYRLKALNGFVCHATGFVFALSSSQFHAISVRRVHVWYVVSAFVGLSSAHICLFK